MLFKVFCWFYFCYVTYQFLTVALSDFSLFRWLTSILILCCILLYNLLRRNLILHNTSEWSEHISALWNVLQFITDDFHLCWMNIKSIMFLCTPSGDAQVHFLCGFCSYRVLHIYRLCMAANSRRHSSLSFQEPYPYLPITDFQSVLLLPILEFQSPVMMMMSFLWTLTSVSSKML